MSEPLIAGHAPDCKCYECGRAWCEANYEKTGTMRQAWVPEAPNFPGTYAAASRTAEQNCTGNVHAALQFETREECAAWCEQNPHPVFAPVEHGFYSQ